MAQSFCPQRGQTALTWGPVAPDSWGGGWPMLLLALLCSWAPFSIQSVSRLVSTGANPGALPGTPFVR